MYQSILRKSAPLLLSLLMLTVGCGGDDDDNLTGSVDNLFTAEETFSFKFGAGDLTRVNITAFSGTVTIVGEANLDSASVSGVRRVESTTLEDAQEQLEELVVSVQELEGRLIVATEQPLDTEGREYTVDYVVSIPDSLLVNCSKIAGIVTTKDLTGAVAVFLTSGQIILDDVSGNTDLNLTAGQIVGSASLTEEGTMSMNVTSGAITLGIPQGTSASFLASVTTGSISITNLVLNNEVVTSTRVSGTLGDGHGEIGLNVVAGNIVVTGN